MTIFGQRDYNVELGTGTGALISQYGCAETSVASILVNCFGKDTDPLRLNQALINVNGYASNGNGAFDIIDWGAVSKIFSDVNIAFNNSYPSSPADLKLIDSQLQKGMSVIAGVSFNHNANDTQPSHYVEIYKKNGDGNYQCRDPWYKDDVSFNQRYAVNGMSVAQCILQVVSYNGPVQAQGTYVDAATFTKLVHNSTEYDKFVAAGYNTIDDIIKKINELSNENTGLKTQIAQVQADNASTMDKYQKQLESDSTAIDAGIKCERDLKTSNTTIQTTANALGCPTDQTSILTAISDLKSKKPLPAPQKTSVGPFLTWLISKGFNF